MAADARPAPIEPAQNSAQRTPTGLSESDARQRLILEGPNDLPRPPRSPLWKVLLGVLKEPMFRLLLAAGMIYLAIGDIGEAALLLIFAAASVAITVVQEARTERALEALRDLSSPRALVIRDGRQQRIAGREVVRGDTVILTEGDRVPADAMLVSALDLAADESLLTGESVPVRKQAAPGAEAPSHPGGDDLSWVFAGSMIVGGRGVAEVRATGQKSELGRIGTQLTTIREEPTPLSLQLHRLVRGFAAAGLGISAVVVLVYGLARGSWLQGLLAGIALAMSLLPEEFPLVLAVFLALGARRIAGRKVLARRSAAVEALGAATVLCCDKTGTLTLNRMSVAELRADRMVHAVTAGGTVPRAFERLVRCAAMACPPQSADPMDKAILQLAGDGTAVGAPLHGYGLSPELLAMAQVWSLPGEGRRTVAAKGAAEAIAELCRMPESDKSAMRREVEDMARRGLRVIAAAEAHFDDGPLPQSQRDFSYGYVGLLGLADPLRPNVARAIEDCRAAGIRVVMVTGDYPATARAIAGQAGLDDAEEVLTGEQIDALDDRQLGERMSKATICARVMPRHKLRIVETLKSAGDVVAMTGDGVNDAPSLRAAHIGVAMGGRGTDVAREAAAMVLLDDEFTSIIEAMRLGRRIYDNIRKAMAYILAVHVPIAALTLVPLLLGWPAILGPVHIVFLEFIIDPMCSIVFEAEPEEKNVMRRPPRAPDEPLFSRRLILWSLLQGALAAALVLGLHAILRRAGMAEPDARAISFVSLVLTNVSLIFVNRGFSTSLLDAILRPNAALWRGLAILGVALAAVLYLPVLRQLFGFGNLHWDDVLFSLPAICLLLPVLEAGKRRFSPLGQGVGNPAT